MKYYAALHKTKPLTTQIRKEIVELEETITNAETKPKRMRYEGSSLSSCCYSSHYVRKRIILDTVISYQ